MTDAPMWQFRSTRAEVFSKIQSQVFHFGESSCNLSVRHILHSFEETELLRVHVRNHLCENLDNILMQRVIYTVAALGTLNETIGSNRLVASVTPDPTRRAESG